MSYVITHTVEQVPVFVSNFHDSGDFHYTCEPTNTKVFATLAEAVDFKEKHDLFDMKIQPSIVK